MAKHPLILLYGCTNAVSCGCRPEVAFLDEATNAVSRSVECELYASLKRRGVTLVSVGHGDSLEDLHDWVLVLRGDGSGEWELRGAAR